MHAQTRKPDDAEGEHFASSSYFDRTFDIEAMKVLPGEYFVTTRNMMIVTVLGSCVAACIRDRQRRIGGMNHFMLAEAGQHVTGNAARYGAYAMELLINRILKSGGSRGSLEAKVFGGGRVMSQLSSSQVGERNAEFVLSYLQAEGIPVVAQDLVGDFPRKVYFFPDTGRVMVKKLVRMHNETLMRRESEYEQRLRTTSVSGDVELFI